MPKSLWYSKGVLKYVQEQVKGKEGCADKETDSEPPHADFCNRTHCTQS
jgi:hypothetical protein